MLAVCIKTSPSVFLFSFLLAPGVQNHKCFLFSLIFFDPNDVHSLPSQIPGDRVPDEGTFDLHPQECQDRSSGGVAAGCNHGGAGHHICG